MSTEEMVQRIRQIAGKTASQGHAGWKQIHDDWTDGDIECVINLSTMAEAVGAMSVNAESAKERIEAKQ